MTIAVWAIIILTTIIALESQWLFAYTDKRFYKSELIRLEDAANRCLEYAYQLHISGVVEEEFVWHVEDITCYGKTGDNLEAITTTSRFWFKKQSDFI